MTSYHPAGTTVPAGSTVEPSCPGKMFHVILHLPDDLSGIGPYDIDTPPHELCHQEFRLFPPAAAALIIKKDDQVNAVFFHHGIEEIMPLP